MSKIKLVLMVLVCTLAFSINAQEKSWADSFEQAKEISLKLNRPILIVFSGSDWCKPCIKLKKEILDTPEFQEAIKDKWVLYNADFPYKTKLPAEHVKVNEKLAESYNKKGAFPLVVLVSKDGKVLAEAKYKKVAPLDYIKLLEYQL